MSNDHQKDMLSHAYGAAGSSDGTFYGELGLQKYEREQQAKKQNKLERQSIKTTRAGKENYASTPFTRKIAACIWTSLGLLLVMYVISENTDSYAVTEKHVAYVAGAVFVLRLWKEILLGATVFAFLYFALTMFTN